MSSASQKPGPPFSGRVPWNKGSLSIEVRALFSAPQKIYINIKRREDFPSAFSFINPLANLICAFGPFLIAGLRAATGSFTLVWIILAVLGLIGVIFMLIFKPKMILDKDRQYRIEAGLPEEGFTKSNAELTREK